MDRSDPLSAIWAKSPVGSENVGESLIAHTESVIARLCEFAHIYPDLGRVCGIDRIWHYAFWACVLHDFGKLAKGFQAQLRKDGGRRWNKRHEVLSLAFVDWVVLRECDEDRAWIAAGIVSHHKDLADIDERYPTDAESESENEELFGELVSEIPCEALPVVADWLQRRIPELAMAVPIPEVATALPSVPGDFDGFAGRGISCIVRCLREVRALKRQLRSLPAGHRWNRTAIALRGLVMLSDHSASAKVSPLPMLALSPGNLYEKLGLQGSRTLYSHQQEAANVEGNLILSAPTGSGKTEAALLWAGRQTVNATCSRLYYVLPYQASLNAMYARFSRHFPDTVALQHGRALQALYRNLLDKGYARKEAAAGARNAKALARLHHHPIRVLTPYQLLRGTFRLKGYEALLTDCTQACFVFDEIHAYEPFRVGMILAVVEYLRTHWGCRFLVMSATLPTKLRSHLEGVLSEFGSVMAAPETYRAFARHRLQVLPGEIDDRGNVARAVEIAKSDKGKSVLLVCNTVRKARRLFDELLSMLGGEEVAIGLLHSRFNSRDRFAKESMLSSRMGTQTRVSDSGAFILVATQVVEVSLDIDFDTVITEPAPLESLVQRFGRVNRSRRHSQSDVYVTSGPLSGERVYDGYYVEASFRVLQEHEGRVIEESTVTNLLDRVYAGAEADKWFDRLQKGREEFTTACLDDLRAFQSSPELEDKFDRMFDGTEVLPSACLDEYRALLTTDPIEAMELLVPIPYWQLSRLEREGRLERGGELGWLNVASVPYDPDFGLEMEVRSDE